MRPAALALAAAALAGCGSTASTPTTLARLEGWTPQRDAPGIGALAPDLHGLVVSERADVAALVRKGQAIRAARFTFATERQAREAVQRGAGDDYQRRLEDAFHAPTARQDGGVRLVVARAAEPGSDVVELYLARRGNTMTVVELVSARGFPSPLRARALAAVSR